MADKLHRELIQLKSERTSHSNRIKGLLAALGLSAVVDENLPERLESLRQWDDQGRTGGFEDAHPPRV